MWLILYKKVQPSSKKVPDGCFLSINEFSFPIIPKKVRGHGADRGQTMHVTDMAPWAHVKGTHTFFLRLHPASPVVRAS